MVNNLTKPIITLITIVVFIAFQMVIYAGSAFGDMEVGIGVYSDEDIYINVDLNTTGDIYYSGDVKYEQTTVQKTVGTVKLYDKLTKLFHTANNKDNHSLIDVKKAFLSELQEFTATVAKYVMWPYVQDLNNRVGALEETAKLIDAQAYCNGKILWMAKQGYEYVECDGIIYYNAGNVSGNKQIVVNVQPVNPEIELVNVTDFPLTIEDMKGFENMTVEDVINKTAEILKREPGLKLKTYKIGDLIPMPEVPNPINIGVLPKLNESYKVV